jgi:Arc/MetJ-type ribon-helix-helix transcriptional regulator
MVTNNKQRLSVSVSNETVELIDESLKLQKFRNKSHAVEFSINKILKGMVGINQGEQ